MRSYLKLKDAEKRLLEIVNSQAIPNNGDEMFLPIRIVPEEWYEAISAKLLEMSKIYPDSDIFSPKNWVKIRFVVVKVMKCSHYRVGGCFVPHLSVEVTDIEFC